MNVEILLGASTLVVEVSLHSLLHGYAVASLGAASSVVLRRLARLLSFPSPQNGFGIAIEGLGSSGRGCSFTTRKSQQLFKLFTSFWIIFKDFEDMTESSCRTACVFTRTSRDLKRHGTRQYLRCLPASVPEKVRNLRKCDNQLMMNGRSLASRRGTKSPSTPCSNNRLL